MKKQLLALLLAFLFALFLIGSCTTTATPLPSESEIPSASPSETPSESPAPSNPSIEDTPMPGSEEAGWLYPAFSLYTMHIPIDAPLILISPNGTQIENYSAEKEGVRVITSHAEVSDYEREYLSVASFVEYWESSHSDFDKSTTTPLTETLPNGLLCSWYLTEASESTLLFFEITSDYFGYVTAVSVNKKVGISQEEIKNIIYTFQISENYEILLASRIGIANEEMGGYYTNDLQYYIPLGALDDWYPYSEDPTVYKKESVLGIHYDSSLMLIESLRYMGVPKGEEITFLQEVYFAEMETENPNFDTITFGEPKSVFFEGLGQEVVLVEAESDAISMRYVVTQLKGYTYVTTFMWVKQEDARFRPIIENAMQRMTLSFSSTEHALFINQYMSTIKKSA
ncbi:MAG: hypothetical protein ACOX3W_09635 [Christensenellaceae bacterium]|jgi:hypothetical protein